MLRLLGRPDSINVRKVLWLCDELGVAPAVEAYGVGFRPTNTPEFRALNPNAMVPVLIDDASAPRFVLWESNAICRYLASTQGRDDLLPATPAGRARVEQWMDWQVAELNQAWRYAFMAHVRKSRLHTDPAAIAASEAQWHRHMAILDRQIEASGGPFVLGADFTLADVVLGLSIHRWHATPMARPRLAAIEAYRDTLGLRPGFRRHGIDAGP